jgi:hypothetical protein
VLFWIAVLPRTTLPVWQLAVIPAALAGAATGWRNTPARRTRLLMLVAAIGLASALFGELAKATIDLRSSLKKQDQAISEADLHRLLLSKSQSARNDDSKPSPPAEKNANPSADANGSSPSTGWFSPLQVATVIYWESLRHHLLGLAASVSLSLFGATQAARLTLRPPAEE